MKYFFFSKTEDDELLTWKKPQLTFNIGKKPNAKEIKLLVILDDSINCAEIELIFFL